MSKSQIQDLHIVNITDLPAVEPGLKVAFGFASAGISINFRGLGNGSGANFIDQSIGLNIDGASFTNGVFYRSGVFDLQQIELLKGPQSLFFGKSTTAGLIVLHTADPTPRLETGVTAGYEVNADEADLNGYISGPLSDTLGIRVAGYRNTMKGFFSNPNPAAPDRRVPPYDEYGGRVTLKYDGGFGLRSTLKLTSAHNHTDSYQGELNQTRCPTGVNPAYPYDDCKVDDIALGNRVLPPYDPSLMYTYGNQAAFSQGSPTSVFGDGSRSVTTAQTATLSTDYDLTKSLTLSSVTALGYVRASDAGASGIVNLAESLHDREISEEARLTSNWRDSWLNFMVDGYYSNVSRRDEFGLVIPAYTLYVDNRLHLLTDVFSTFGQVLLTPIRHLELSAGLRYTHVDKRFVSLITQNNYPTFFNPGPSGQNIQNVPEANREFKQSNVSPEITLTYRPTPILTAFLSYKEGYKGPGFNASLTATSYTASNVSPFGGEKVHGVEGGIKAKLLDRQLLLTATGYRYLYDGLQVSFTNVVTSVVTIAPDANAKVQGVELGATLTPRALPGVSLSGFANYNDSHYTRFTNAPCYGNQPASAGCSTSPNGARFQDLSGRTLNMAPRWSGSLDLSYKTRLNDALDAAINVGSQLSSHYEFTPELHPLARQAGYATLDLAAHLTRHSGAWDAAIICTNCTNRRYFVSGQDGNTAPGVISTVQGYIARPWQLMFQITLHPDLLFR